MRHTSALKGSHNMYRLGIALLLTSSAFAQGARFVVGIGGVMHESNSFNPAKTVVADFAGMRGAAELTGADLIQAWRKSSTEVTGYLDGADAEKFDVHPGYVSWATPKGPLTRETFDTLA